ncbi:MAG: PAS domain-containing sensor histidine kinase [Candidatus Hodarchaeales archaeon]|jgi:PAS domain S-box-containing protein
MVWGLLQPTSLNVRKQKGHYESERKYRNLLDNLSDTVIEIDSEGKFTYISPQSFELWGYRPEEGIGKNAFEFIHPDDLEIAMEEMTKALEGKSVFNFEYRGRMIKEDDDSKIISVVRDITERKKAEEKLRESEKRFKELADLLPQIVFETDETGNFTFLNRYWFDSTGFTLEDFENGLSPFDMVISEEKEMLAQFIQTIMRGEKELRQEYTAMRKDGSTYPVVVYPTAIIRNDKPVGLRGITIDITERKQTEKTKEDLEKKRSAFISMASHELRTPITVIKGYTEFLNKNIENIDSIRKAQAIQSISRNVVRLERLIEGVADITRIDQGLFELNTSVCDFSKFLKESTQPYKEVYVNKFSIHGTLEFESPVFLNIDIDRIRQVLDNLLDNANKNTPEDGRIVLTPTVLSNTIQIAISDTGVGIGSNDLERIFEQFVSITTEQASGGTGIGLYVSRIICESHGGTLTAHSEGKNQGATFNIELPRWFE